tara:strand:+ start:577 stop:813 length:237 start_codon:yes stop_codon:yes gene_type:complete
MKEKKIELENIRQDVISNSSYFSNMFASIDFLKNHLDNNNIEKAKTELQFILKDVISLGKQNKILQQKLIDLNKTSKI